MDKTVEELLEESLKINQDYREMIYNLQTMIDNDNKIIEAQKKVMEIDDIVIENYKKVLEVNGIEI